MTADVVGDTDDGAFPEHARLGEYRLVQRLGEGGMGVVHLALDRHGRAVALKVLRPHVAHDPAARERLAREVATLARVSSPRVAPVIDADIDGDQPYIVTRYVPGPPLDEVVAADGPMGAVDLLRLGAGLAEALGVIHAADVIHRDLKPANVLLVDGDPVVIDFGIAHAADDVRLTMTGLVMGTPGYLAPEVVEGAPVTRATDWWGWAATLAFAASGVPPFGRGALEGVLARVSRGEPDLAAVDARLAPLLYAALSPRPLERPHHDEVVAALERFAQGGPVTDAVQLRRPIGATQVFDIPRTSVIPSRSPAGGTSNAGPALRPPSGRGREWRASPPGALRPNGTSGAAAPGPPPGAGQPAGTTPGSASPRAPLPPVPPGQRAGIPAGVRPVSDPWALPSARPASDLVPRPPQVDPRIGRPQRSGTLLTLLALLTAGAAAAPAATTLLFLAWVVAARTADRSVTSLVMRRHERGRRRSDVAVAVASSPWHLVVGIVGSAFSVVIPLLVGVAGAFSAAVVIAAVRGGTADPGAPVALAVAGLLSALMAWWGPGGAGLRRGTRSIVRGMTPGPVSSQVVAGMAIVAAAVVAGWVSVHGIPTWAPFAGPPSLWNPLP